MPQQISRRTLLTAAGLAVGGSVAAGLVHSQAQAAQSERTAAEPFGYCLNTSTIRGQDLGIQAEVEIAAKAGYQALEPWIKQLETFVKAGGSLRDLGKRIADHGMTVESAIGFAPWIVEDEAARKKGLEQARRDMDLVRQIGGKRIAAPPVGATDLANFDLRKAAERYRALLVLGEEMGVTPEVELWGFSKTLSRLSEVAFVAIESGHAQACLLLDVYHLYKGGSDPTAIKLLSGHAMHVLHTNDYPGEPARAEIKDAQRVYPGDGVAPLGELFRNLKAIGYQGYLSIELFNPSYWKQDALLVAKTALEKLRGVVQKSLA